MSKLRSWTALIPAVLAMSCARTSGGVTGAPEPSVVQARSLLGRPLLAPRDTSAAARGHVSVPSDASVDSLLAWGRAAATRWRYREAIALYSRAIDLAPADWRAYRHRGHRYISIRRFEDAARDLDRAHSLDSTQFDIEYHRGLAYYLLGRFGEAAEIYGRCMAQGDAGMVATDDTARSDPRRCSDIAIDDDSRVAMTDWQYRALRRAGRAPEASALLGPIREGMVVRENLSYYENLRRYAGRTTEDAVLAAAGSDSVRLATSGYGLANYRLVEGDTTGAVAMLERLAESPHWPAFAVIAAEADLVRLGPGRTRSSDP